jgi:FlaA1/EpsC-like NDP-sugar epimerase
VSEAGPPDQGSFRTRTWPDRIVERFRRDIPLLGLDLAVVFFAYLGPLVLRFDGAVPATYWDRFRIFLPAVIVLHLATNALFGLYGEIWRYASVQEARRVILAGLSAGGFVVGLSAWMRTGDRLLPLSVMILGTILSLIGFGAVRFQSRLFGFHRRTAEPGRSQVLIVGAGEAGAMVLKDIQRNPALRLSPVGLVDDDPRKVGLRIHEVRVVGRLPDLSSILASIQVDQVLFAIPSAKAQVLRDVAAVCEKAGVAVRVLPSVREMVGPRVTARDIRDLRIEDLLGREQIQTDLDSVRALLRGKRVLVTGAGGSIGSEIVRQVATFEPSALILLDHDETHLHDVMTELEGDLEVEVGLALADIRDRERMLAVFRQHSPEVVFHAAAHKHVPLLETHPDEAVLTNVLGTANVADAALVTGVKTFVLISTDKAINPSSIMGVTKWLAEELIQSLQNGGPVYCAVRFGNVLGSRGSVIPTFIRQIERGGPVTVTDPSMIRYFMSVQEAVQLVLQAAAQSRGGEVFTLDMGEPVRILDLAEKVIRMSGRVPGSDIAIAIVGPRPGERLQEIALHPDEDVIASEHPSIMISRPKPADRVPLRSTIARLEKLARAGERDELYGRLRSLGKRRPMPAEITLDSSPRKGKTAAMRDAP